MTNSVEIVKNIIVNNDLPLDGKYWNNKTPHASVEAACITIPLNKRGRGLTIFLDDGKEYWWKDGVTNIDLVLKTNQNIVGGGVDGKSTYQLAVDNGYIGTVEAWLVSIKGQNGIAGVIGKSAYEQIVELGYIGTIQEWAISLKGEDGNDGNDGNGGKSAYELAVDNGYVGTIQNWITTLRGIQGIKGNDGINGKSTYQLGLDSGFVGTVEEWLESIKGQIGNIGRSAYEFAVDGGFIGSIEEWLLSLKGATGTSVTILGSFDTEAELIAAFPTGDPNDGGYLIHGNLYFWTQGVWEDLGNIQGPRGLPGVGGLSVVIGTYSELKILQTNNELVQGRLYLLTDFATSYVQPISGILKTCAIEVLLLTAVSENSFDQKCQSKTYPQDTIYYNFNSNVDGATTGRITRRIDNILKNDIGSDWRHILTRRYALNVTNNWISGGSYNSGDIVTNSNMIYICLKTHTNSVLISQYSNWIKFGFNNGEHAGLYTNGHPVWINNVQYYIPVNSSLFTDSPMFRNYTSGIHHNTIIQEGINNFAVLGPNLKYVNLGDLNTNWTINNNNKYIKVDNENLSLTIGSNNLNLNIGNSNDNLTIGDDNYNLNILNDNDRFIIGSVNGDFNIKSLNKDITIGNNNSQLIMCNSNLRWRIKNNCKGLNIGNNNTDWKLSDANNFVTVGNDNTNWSMDNIAPNMGLWKFGNKMSGVGKVLPVDTWTQNVQMDIDLANTKILLKYTDEFSDINIIEL